MKDLKNLKPTEICIRATKENADKIIPLLERLGGVDDIIKGKMSAFISDYIGISKSDSRSIVMCVTSRAERTELTIEELTEMVRLHEGGLDKQEPSEFMLYIKSHFIDEESGFGLSTVNSLHLRCFENIMRSYHNDKLSLLEGENKELTDLVKDCVDLVDNCTNRDNAVFTLNTIREKIYKTLKAKQILNQ